MKKLFGLLFCYVVLGIGCTKTALTEANNDEILPTLSISAHRNCATQEVFEAQLKADPTLATKMEAIEEFTARVTNNPSAFRLLSNGVIQIPVVVNVVYNTEDENISLSQIQSQIDILNADFGGTNKDINKVPKYFVSVKAGDVNVRFVLDTVIRVLTSKTSFGTNNGVKKSAGGGIAPTSPLTKLNMWTCNLGNGILGYAQFPGGNPATDGIVVLYNAFGVTNLVPYDKGRTATHEVGHWLNLRHIWGDTKCGNDFVADTPLHTGANFGCPPEGTRSTCVGTPIMMTMNYMDYTEDLCMFMFSMGQKTRMNATFVVGGPRISYAQP